MNSRFDVADTPLRELKVLQRKPISDQRGYLERIFCAGELDSLIGGKRIVQINRTLTAKRGTVRGMHVQNAPYGETKLVSCLRGEVFDVAVDLRQGSSTFLQWHAEILSADNHKTMLIPEGFAHGFQTLDNYCELLYLHTAMFHSQAEVGFNAQDPMLAIRWPEPITEQSERDASHAALTTHFGGIAA